MVGQVQSFISHVGRGVKRKINESKKAVSKKTKSFFKGRQIRSKSYTPARRRTDSFVKKTLSSIRSKASLSIKRHTYSHPETSSKEKINEVTKNLVPNKQVLKEISSLKGTPTRDGSHIQRAIKLIETYKTYREEGNLPILNEEEKKALAEASEKTSISPSLKTTLDEVEKKLEKTIKASPKPLPKSPSLQSKSDRLKVNQLKKVFDIYRQEGNSPILNREEKEALSEAFKTLNFPENFNFFSTAKKTIAPSISNELRSKLGEIEKKFEAASGKKIDELIINASSNKVTNREQDRSLPSKQPSIQDLQQLTIGDAFTMLRKAKGAKKKDILRTLEESYSSVMSEAFRSIPKDQLLEGKNAFTVAFNRVSKQVLYNIFKDPCNLRIVENRVKVYLKIARLALKAGDVATAQAINGGLGNQAIYRLQKNGTFRKKTINSIEQLKEQLNRKNIYRLNQKFKLPFVGDYTTEMEIDYKSNQGRFAKEKLINDLCQKLFPTDSNPKTEDKGSMSKNEIIIDFFKEAKLNKHEQEILLRLVQFIDNEKLTPINGKALVNAQLLLPYVDVGNLDDNTKLDLYMIEAEIHRNQPISNEKFSALKKERAKKLLSIEMQSKQNALPSPSTSVQPLSAEIVAEGTRVQAHINAIEVGKYNLEKIKQRKEELEMELATLEDTENNKGAIVDKKGQIREFARKLARAGEANEEMKRLGSPSIINYEAFFDTRSKAIMSRRRALSY